MTDWPDWTGRAVAIIASGPSAKIAGVEHLQGRITTLAIKRNVELAPWSEAVYGCDFPWWRSVRGLPDFDGWRFAYDARACDQFGVQAVKIPDPKCDRLLFGETGAVGAGGNSGFQATNLAVQFGAKRILLIGFDATDRGGVHWYGRNGWAGGNNPSEHNFRRWKTALEAAEPDLRARGVEVVNASLQSAIQAYRKVGVTETLKAWGLW